MGSYVYVKLMFSFLSSYRKAITEVSNTIHQTESFDSSNSITLAHQINQITARQRLNNALTGLKWFE